MHREGPLALARAKICYIGVKADSALNSKGVRGKLDIARSVYEA